MVTAQLVVLNLYILVVDHITEAMWPASLRGSTFVIIRFMQPMPVAKVWMAISCKVIGITSPSTLSGNDVSSCRSQTAFHILVNIGISNFALVRHSNIERLIS